MKCQNKEIRKTRTDTLRHVTVNTYELVWGERKSTENNIEIKKQNGCHIVREQ